MTYQLSEEHQALVEAVREFTQEVIAPVSAHHDATHTFPYQVVAQMGEMGLFGLPFPEEYGGSGGDYLAFCLALEEIAAYDQSVAITLEAGVGLGAMPVYRYGTEDQKQQWLPDLTAGTALAGFALTESEAGSDASGTRTTAALDDGEWVINGTKEFITNSGTDITSMVIATAVTGSGDRGVRSGNPEISTIIVPAGTPGFTVGKAYDKVGWNASDTHPLAFDAVRVPESHLLGDQGRGYANFLGILDEGRVAIAAMATGAAQGCVDQATAHAAQRKAFGSTIGEFQGISFKIARMQARAHTARLAYRHAAELIAAGKPFKTEAAMAKLVASEAAMDNARDATQVLGGYGFMNEHTVARHYRDSKILEIGEGTTEVQLMLIARSLGLG